MYTAVCNSSKVIASVTVRAVWHFVHYSQMEIVRIEKWPLLRTSSIFSSHYEVNVSCQNSHAKVLDKYPLWKINIHALVSLPDCLPVQPVGLALLLSRAIAIAYHPKFHFRPTPHTVQSSFTQSKKTTHFLWNRREENEGNKWLVWWSTENSQSQVVLLYMSGKVEAEFQPWISPK